MEKLEPNRLNLLRRLSLVILPTLLVLLTLTLLFWQQLNRSNELLRKETLIQTDLRAEQVNNGLSAAVSMLFFNADVALLDLIDLYKANNNSPRFTELAKLVLGRFPAKSVLQVAVIGPKGYLEYSNIDPQSRVYLGFREHFVVHLQNEKPQLFVSAPVIGKVSKQWSIQFTRPIFQKGRFSGVMVLSLSPTYLVDTLIKLTSNTEDVITIVRNTGEVLARSKNFELAIGSKMPSTLPFLIQTPARNSGSYQSEDLYDNTHRLFRWTKLDDYPVTVLLGIRTSVITGPIDKSIKDERLKSLIGTLMMWFISVLALILTLRMQSNIKRRLQSENAAHHDALTGLYNRLALHRRFDRSLKVVSSRNQYPRLAVLFIDLDGFKPINDLHGHLAGDEVLKAVGKRIKNSARETDIVARLGGDEFVVVIPELHDDDHVQLLTSRIQKALEEPIVVNEQKITIGVSIGKALCPEDGHTVDELLGAADKRMYLIKNKKR